MDSILKSFSIGFLLRSVFSGIFFVIAYYVSFHDPHELVKIESSLLFSVALPVALFAGVMAYGIHRSLVYPFIECWFDSASGKRSRECFPLIQPSTIETLLWRWNQGCKQAELDCKVINEHLNTWADFIHLQFTSALSILLGAIAGFNVDPEKYFFHYQLIFLTALFLISAFVSNWRSHTVLDHVKIREKQLSITDLRNSDLNDTGR